MEQLTFSPDLPINSAKDDKLNRSPFASALASAIRNWNQTSSLVVALYGDWGSGKSSVKNMILESLHDGVAEEERLGIIEFNPWQITSQENLSRAFFDEVGSALGKPRKGEAKEEAEKRAAKWKTYSAYFSVGTSVTKSLKVVLPLLGVPIVGEALDTFLQGLEKSASIAKEGAEGIEASGRATGGTLHHLKKDVTDSLISLKRPLLVVLDDVDRLTHDEIRLLLQLIKANADFPNIIYLVLAQRETVVKALETVAPDQGEAFLEKIVQVGFNVPRIERRQLESILFSGLDRMLADERVGKRFDTAHWVTLYRDGLSHFFGNLRDVNRFLSSLAFHVGVFRSEKSFEVNPVDLIAVEVLRVFAPMAYSGLSNAKHIVTDEPRFMRKEEKDKDLTVIKGILDSLPAEDQGPVTKIIEHLFPPAAQVLNGSHFSGDGGNNWFADLRVASHDVFDRYFQFATPSGDISQSELDEVLAVVGDRTVLGTKFKELGARSLLPVLLDRLDSYKERLPIEHAESLVTALFDLDADDDDGFFSVTFSPQTHIQRIIYWYLRRIPDQARRKQILKNALASTTGLYTAVKAVTWLETKASESQPTDRDAVLEKPEDIAELRIDAMALILAAASNGRLEAEDRIGFLLSVWNQWGVKTQMQAWVLGFVSTPKGLLRFLKALRGTVRSSNGPIPVERHYFKLSVVEAFSPIEPLSTAIDALTTDTLTEDELLTVKLYKKAIQDRVAGKPETNWMDV
jgi:predicted KAP-like P-loop ATPase